jgi:F-type H+-transporting ATPase subunit b
MEEILHAFGINGKLIVVQIVNFAILAGVLTYFLYTPILKLLNDREAKIKKGVEDAEKAEEALAQADTEKKTIVSLAHKEAEEIGARAKTHADVKAGEIVSEAQEKAVQVLANATARGEELKAQAKKESEAEIAKLAMLAAEKVLREKGA